MSWTLIKNETDWINYLHSLRSLSHGGYIPAKSKDICVPQSLPCLVDFVYMEPYGKFLFVTIHDSHRLIEADRTSQGISDGLKEYD